MNKYDTYYSIHEYDIYISKLVNSISDRRFDDLIPLETNFTTMLSKVYET